MTSMLKRPAKRRYHGAMITAASSSCNFGGMPEQHEHELLSSIGSPP